jgi:hypothetical protein
MPDLPHRADLLEPAAALFDQPAAAQSDRVARVHDRPAVEDAVQAVQHVLGRVIDGRTEAA